MIVYHGTTFDRLDSIEKDKSLKITTEKNTSYPGVSEYLRTVYGYVYVSIHLNAAFGFGVNATKDKSNGTPNKYVIFEIDIKEEELQLDDYETINTTSVTQVMPPYPHAYKIQRDLLFGKDIKKYCVLEYSDYQHACRDCDDEQLDKKISKKWSDL